MSLYVCEIKENLLITHDGHIQLGIYNLSLKEFFENSKIEYMETYWIPDTFNKRYKRLNYQKHLLQRGQNLD